MFNKGKKSMLFIFCAQTLDMRRNLVFICDNLRPVVRIQARRQR